MSRFRVLFGFVFSLGLFTTFQIQTAKSQSVEWQEPKSGLICKSSNISYRSTIRVGDQYLGSALTGQSNCGRWKEATYVYVVEDAPDSYNDTEGVGVQVVLHKVKAEGDEPPEMIKATSLHIDLPGLQADSLSRCTPLVNGSCVLFFGYQAVVVSFESKAWKLLLLSDRGAFLYDRARVLNHVEKENSSEIDFDFASGLELEWQIAYYDQQFTCLKVRSSGFRELHSQYLVRLDHEKLSATNYFGTPRPENATYLLPESFIRVGKRLLVVSFYEDYLVLSDLEDAEKVRDVQCGDMTGCCCSYVNNELSVVTIDTRDKTIYLAVQADEIVRLPDIETKRALRPLVTDDRLGLFDEMTGERCFELDTANWSWQSLENE